MIIHPTRTNLLAMKDKKTSVANSIGILKARRQALIREFLNTTLPFLRSREDIRRIYGKAVHELRVSLGREGAETVHSVEVSAKRDFQVDIRDKSIWGLRYREIAVHDNTLRDPDNRGYALCTTSIHVEECASLFEQVMDLAIHLAEYENKLKRLSDEILGITRKMKVLEERILPELKIMIRSVSQYISERERENYFRLKKFKQSR